MSSILSTGISLPSVSFPCYVSVLQLHPPLHSEEILLYVDRADIENPSDSKASPMSCLVRLTIDKFVSI